MARMPVWHVQTWTQPNPRTRATLHENKQQRAPDALQALARFVKTARLDPVTICDAETRRANPDDGSER